MWNWNIFIILLSSSRNDIGKNYVVELKKKERVKVRVKLTKRKYFSFVLPLIVQSMS